MHAFFFPVKTVFCLGLKFLTRNVATDKEINDSFAVFSEKRVL